MLQCQQGTYFISTHSSPYLLPVAGSLNTITCKVNMIDLLRWISYNITVSRIYPHLHMFWDVTLYNMFQFSLNAWKLFDQHQSSSRCTHANRSRNLPLSRRWRHWRVTWVRLDKNTAMRWSDCRLPWPSWRTTYPSCVWTCSATKPTTSSSCASSRTWRWRSQPTGDCWRERRRECQDTYICVCEICMTLI